jgi:hypothetical protein
MTELEYPATYETANRASGAYQTRFIIRKKSEYLGAAIAAVISILPAQRGAPYQWFALAGVAVLVTTIIIMFLERNSEAKAAWYKTRALAEAIKAESWRFRCAVAPEYSADRTDAEARRSFQGVVDAVESSLDVAKHLVGHECSGPETRAEMLETRRLALLERAARYKDMRIMDQVAWYDSRAVQAQASSRRYSLGAISFLLGGLFLYAMQFFNMLGPYSVFGVFSTFAVTLLGWAEVRRYGTLAITYARAREELRSISQLVLDVAGESDLAAMVADAEAVISKEHSIWYGKGDVT